MHSKVRHSDTGHQLKNRARQSCYVVQEILWHAPVRLVVQTFFPSLRAMKRLPPPCFLSCAGLAMVQVTATIRDSSDCVSYLMECPTHGLDATITISHHSGIAIQWIY